MASGGAKYQNYSRFPSHRPFQKCDINYPIRGLLNLFVIYLISFIRLSILPIDVYTSEISLGYS
ncbi:CLUMA_CG016926, isoform A [Clunio marinus]|uniref:CLUMA_CG016926, isoform A n=1 Tax=Clunio marinus TaxID=568069 RepID=A0A1J1ITD5_9DIPT|nr:CLUMA_CG016926, isoform A [Clunio marinus]